MTDRPLTEQEVRAMLETLQETGQFYADPADILRDWLRLREALKRMQGYAVDHSEGRWSSPGTVARMAHEVNATLAASAEEEK